MDKLSTLAKAPIGILDSGLGGLSVAKAIQDALPRESFIYSADCGYAPWGERDDQYVNDRVDRIVSYLLGRGIKAIVIACNTATAVSIERLRRQHTIPIIGIEPAVLPAVKQTKTGTIAVLATPKTIASEKYRSLSAPLKENPALQIIDCPAPGLMQCVEAGEFSSPKTMTLLHRYLDLPASKGADTVVLGCTHYPFLSAAIHQVMGSDVTLIDPAPAVARQLKHRLEETHLLNEEARYGSQEFLASDATAEREKVLQRLWQDNVTLEALRV